MLLVFFFFFQKKRNARRACLEIGSENSRLTENCGQTLFNETNIEVGKAARAARETSFYSCGFPFVELFHLVSQPSRGWSRSEKRRKVRYIRSRSARQVEFLKCRSIQPRFALALFRYFFASSLSLCSLFSLRCPVSILPLSL